MKYVILFTLLFLSRAISAQAPPVDPADWPELKGLWTFDDPQNLTQAAFGTDLYLNGTHISVPGPQAGDLAVNIGVGSHYTCYHGIPANGGGNETNEYTLVIDFRVPAPGMWYCFYQTHAMNANDGELFVSPSGTLGRATNGPGYTEYAITPGEWYRLTVTADLGSQYRIFLDGTLVREGGALAVDGDYALLPASFNNFFYFFADDNAEDNPIDIALCAVFEGALTVSQAQELGGYGHDIPGLLTGILPYLQTPDPASMYVSWHSDSLSSTKVVYGTGGQPSDTAYGTFENIGGKKWHTVKLENLQPGSTYQYRCFSGTSASDLYHFRTPTLPQAQGQHIRFLVFGDNQTDYAKARQIAEQARDRMTGMFGPDLHNQIDLVINHGDIVDYGLSASLYETQYFKPFSCLTAVIPSMVSIGNHELESPYYYQYMKYEDISGNGTPDPERCYAFRLGSVMFVALNTNPLYQNALQLEWLNGQLAEAEADTAVDFVVVYGHHPGRSEVWPAGNTAWVQNNVLPAIAACSKSAFYLSGHTHAYEHGVGESLTGAGDFRLQISGGAGGALDRWGMFGNQTDYPEVFKSFDHYNFTLIDINVDDRSYEGYTFSLGHPELNWGCQLVDRFHRYLDREAPAAPVPAGPVAGVVVPDSAAVTGLVLDAGIYSGADTLMTTQFQLTATPGDYSAPLTDVTRDRENWYGTTGSPDYHAVNLNAGIDLMRLECPVPLQTGQTYGWRVRCRDYNLNWSAWSEELLFTPVTGFSVSGRVLYANAGESPLSPVALSLFRNDTLVAQTSTDTAGLFTFPLAVLPGSFSVTCTTGAPWGGVNATDALMILRHFVGLQQLAGLFLTAANTDGSGIVNAVDALAVSKRFTGMINEFPPGDWVFEEVGFSVGNADVNLNIRAVCTGDVNGSYVP